MFSLFKKKKNIKKLGTFFAHICTHGVPGIDIDEMICSSTVNREVFQEELMYLTHFAVDYGTTLELGFHNPYRNAILDACIYHHIKDMIIAGELPINFSDKLNARLLEYTDILKASGDASVFLPEMGAVFISHLGCGIDPFFSAKVATYWGAVIIGVRQILRSVRITS